MERDKFVELVKKWHDQIYFNVVPSESIEALETLQEMRDFVCPLGAITDEDREWARKVLNGL